MILIAKRQQDDPLTKLEKAYAHWQSLYDHGGSDPTWPDGVNLNLVRNHICYYKRQIEEACPLHMSHELYQRPLPPEVDDNYMARADETRERAKKSLQAYLADPDYRYLLRHKDSLSPRFRQELHMENVLGYGVRPASASSFSCPRCQVVLPSLRGARQPCSANPAGVF